MTAVLATGLIVATLLPASSATTIRVYEKHRLGFERFINLDGKHSIAGDTDIQDNPLFRVGAGTNVGRDIVQVVFIHRLPHNDARFRVAATFRIGRGKLEIAGTSKLSKLDRGTATFAITGGTGKYNGASGTLIVHEKRFRTSFTLHVIP